jgi:hypothetical protein
MYSADGSLEGSRATVSARIRRTHGGRAASRKITTSRPTTHEEIGSARGGPQRWCHELTTRPTVNIDATNEHIPAESCGLSTHW